LHIIEIAGPQVPTDPILLERFTIAHLPDRTVEFLLFVGEEEAGLLVFEVWPNSSIGIIHEIFVLKRFGMKGLGTSLLAEAHAYAARVGITRLQLTPRCVQPGRVSDEDLARWYGSHGFSFLPDSTVQMLKDL